MIATKSRTWYAAALVFLTGLTITGCDHVTDSEGPNLIDRFGDFSVVDSLMVNRMEVDFTASQSVVFTARFNKQVDWIVEITGDSSGAVKRIEGFSNELTEENARWLGGTTDLPLFRSEPVSVALLIVDEEDADTLRTNIEVLVPREYEGDVVTGFEQDDEDANVVLRNFEFELDPTSGISMEVPAGEGESFFILRGTDTVVDNFFVGLAEITSTSEDGYFTIPTSVPEDLFFNAFLYNFGSENTIVILELVVDVNGNGTFDGSDAIFGSGEIRLDEPGWTLFSRSVAEFGLTQEQAEQIVAIRPVLISDNNSQPTPRVPVDFGLDYLTFTAGGPLEL